MMKLTLYFALIYQLSQLTEGFVSPNQLNNLLWSPPGCIACYYDEAINYFNNLNRLTPRCADDEIYEFRRIPRKLFLLHICEYQTGTGFKSKYEELQTRGKIVLQRFQKCFKRNTFTSVDAEKLKKFTISFENGKKRCEDKNFLKGDLINIHKIYPKPAPLPLQARKKIKKPIYKKPAKNRLSKDQADTLLKYPTKVAEKKKTPKAEDLPKSDKLSSETLAIGQNIVLPNDTTDDFENNTEIFHDAEDSFVDETENKETILDDASTPIVDLETFEDPSTPLKGFVDETENKETILDDASTPIVDLETFEDPSTPLKADETENKETISDDASTPIVDLETFEDPSTPLKADVVQDNYSASDNTLNPSEDSEISNNRLEVVSPPADNKEEEVQDEINLDHVPNSSKNQSEPLANDSVEKDTAEEIHDRKTSSENIIDSSENQSEPLANDTAAKDTVGEGVQDEKINLEGNLDSPKNQSEPSVEDLVKNDNEEEIQESETSLENILNSFENQSKPLVGDLVEKEEIETSLENNLDSSENQPSNASVKEEVQDDKTNFEDRTSSENIDSPKNQSELLVNDATAKDTVGEEVQVDKINSEGNLNSPENQSEPSVDDSVKNDTEEIQESETSLENILNSSKNQSEPLLGDPVEKDTTEEIVDIETSLENNLDSSENQPSNASVKDTILEGVQDDKTNFEDRTSSENIESPKNQSEPLVNDVAVNDTVGEEVQDKKINLEGNLDSPKNQSEPSVDDSVKNDTEEIHESETSSENILDSSENQSEPLVDNPVTNENVDSKTSSENILDSSKNQPSDASAQDTILEEVQDDKTNFEDNHDSSENKSESIVEDFVQNYTLEEIQDSGTSSENNVDFSENQSEPLVNDAAAIDTIEEEVQDNKINSEGNLDFPKNQSEPLVEDLVKNDTEEEIQESRTSSGNIFNSSENQSEPLTNDIIETPAQVQDYLETVDDQFKTLETSAFASDAQDDEMDPEYGSESPVNEPVTEDLPPVQNNEIVSQNNPSLPTDTSSIDLSEEQPVSLATNASSHVQEKEALIAAPVGTTEIDSSESPTDHFTATLSDTLVENPSHDQGDKTISEDGLKSSVMQAGDIPSDSINESMPNSDSPIGTSEFTTENQPELHTNDVASNVDNSLEKVPETITEDESTPLIHESQEELPHTPESNPHSENENKIPTEIDTSLDDSIEIKSEEEISSQDTDSQVDKLDEVPIIEDHYGPSLPKISPEEESTVPKTSDSYVENLNQTQKHAPIAEDTSALPLPEIKLEDELTPSTHDSHSDDNLGGTKSDDKILPQTTDPHVKDLNHIQEDVPITEENSTQSSLENDTMNKDISTPPLKDIPIKPSPELQENIVTPEIVPETKPNELAEHVSGSQTSDGTLIDDSSTSSNDPSSLEPMNLVERISTTKDNVTPTKDDITSVPTENEGTHESSISKLTETDADNASLESSLNIEKNEKPCDDQVIHTSNDDLLSNLNEGSNENIPEDNPQQQFEKSDFVPKPELNDETSNSSSSLPTIEASENFSGFVPPSENQTPITQDDVSLEQQSEPEQVDPTINSIENPTNADNITTSNADDSPQNDSGANSVLTEEQNELQNEIEESKEDQSSR